MIDVNPYILGIQFINFLVGLWIINNFIIAPIRKVLAERKNKIDHANEDISGLFSSAKLKLDNYENELKSSQLEAASIRNEMKLKDESQAGHTLNEASESARKQIQEAHQNLLSEKEKALAQLNSELGNFVSLAETKLLAR